MYFLFDNRLLPKKSKKLILKPDLSIKSAFEFVFSCYQFTKVIIQ